MKQKIKFLTLGLLVSTFFSGASYAGDEDVLVTSIPNGSRLIVTTRIEIPAEIDSLGFSGPIHVWGTCNLGMQASSGRRYIPRGAIFEIQKSRWSYGVYKGWPDRSSYDAILVSKDDSTKTLNLNCGAPAVWTNSVGAVTIAELRLILKKHFRLSLSSAKKY